MKIDLSGRAALVTGAGSGIGAGCARVLSEAGAFVWVNDKDRAKAVAVAKEVGGQPLVGQVGRETSWLQPVLDRGVLHVLVHNAGYDLETVVGRTDMASVEELLRVQVSGPLNITEKLLGPLEAANGALVVHIASVHARITSGGTSAYAAAKGAQVAMVNSMAQDLGAKKIRVPFHLAGVREHFPVSKLGGATSRPRGGQAASSRTSPSGAGRNS